MIKIEIKIENREERNVSWDKNVKILTLIIFEENNDEWSKKVF